MKTINIIFSIFLFCNFSFGQIGKMNSKKYDEKLEKSSLSEIDKDAIKFNLKKVKDSEYDQHIRIKTIWKIIDLYRNKDDKFKGTILNHTVDSKEKIKSYGIYESKSTKYYFRKDVLSDKLSQDLAYQILESGQEQFPTDSNITQWKPSFFDCYSIEFEFKTEKGYTSNSYYCPWGQNDSISIADAIITNYTLSFRNNEIDSLEEVFFNDLPKGKYYEKGVYHLIYCPTEKEKIRWKKFAPHRNYMKSVKDTLRIFFQDTLNREIIASENINCWYSYHAYFSPKGKFIKIKTRDKVPLFERLMDKESRRCKRRLRKALRKIKVDFIKPQHPYSIYIDFDINGKIEIFP